MMEYFARHPTIANLLMIGFFAVGLTSLPSLQRATFPRIQADTVQISVVYPGATPDVVEEAICQRLEDAVDSVDSVAEMACESRESLATAKVEMTEGSDLDRFFSDVRVQVEAINDFPDGAESPVLSQIGRTDFVASLAITGPSDRTQLKSYAEVIKDRMQAFGGIPKVTIKGFSERQLRIEIPDETLREFNLSFADIARAIERQNVDRPVGTLTSKNAELLLRFDDQRTTIADLSDLVVVTAPNGGQIRLGNLATITDQFENDEVKILFNGKPAALLEVVKSEQEDTLDVADRITAFAETEQARAPPGVKLTVTNDGSNIVRERLALLLKNGWQGLLLVALTTWAFFGFRYAFWIAMGLPVAFMGGIAVMATFGYSINMLTMVALLIVVGILMDDAIVISENIATKYESGLAPMDAAAKGVSEVMPGVLSSFLTTLCIFGSLAFLQGDIGQILRVVPVVMIAVLAASLVEAFLILPSHLGHALHGRSTEPGYVQQKSNDGIDWARERLIGRAARACVTARYLTLGVAFAALILAVSAMAGGLLKFSAFPDLDGDTLEARILLPQGTPLERTERVVDTVNAALDRVAATLDEARGDDSKLVRNRTVEFNKNKDAFETGPHVATISVDVLNSELRSVTNDALFAQWRKEVGQLPDVIALRFDEPATGPAGIAIDVRLKGRDLSALKAASVDMQTWFNRYDGVVDLLDDLRLGKPELRFRIKDEGSALGLRADDIANQVRAAFLGSTVDEIQTDRDFFEVDTRLIQAQRDKRQTLDEFVVMTSDGAAVPLSAVATIEEGRGFARINRIDGVRTVSVRGNVNPAIANANEIIGDMRARFLPGFTERHPDVTVSIAGQDAEAGKTQSSMISGFMLGLIGVYLVLSFQFRSYWEPVVVMILIPFAFIGAIVGHILMGIDFTMPSMLGFAALSGIVVNDSILLVNQIKDHHEPGATVADVAPSASQSRFRAIFLTSLTTVLGLTPLLLETSLQAQILIPLVTSLAFGLMASTILVLFVVPSFYAVLDDFGLTTLAKERKARDRESDLAGAAPAE